MRKVLMAALLAALLSPAVNATDLGVKYTHTITAADTTAQGWRDTVYSSWVDLSQMGSTFWFSVQVTGGGKASDTNFAHGTGKGDTCWAYLQHASGNRGSAGLEADMGRTNLLIQKMSLINTDNDTLANSTVKLRADSTWTGTWARGMFIYYDTATIGRTTSGTVGTVVTYYLKLWVNGFLK